MNRRQIMASAAMAGVAAAGTAKTAAVAAAAPSPSAISLADGQVLRVRDWGAGPPVLLVHSWALNSDMWEYQVNALTAAGYRCIAFDRRGHGWSPESRSGYGADLMADDIAGVIETLDLRNLALVGHSLGCAEIARYCGRHGTGRLSRIVMLAPTTPFILQTEDNPNGVPRAAMEKTLNDLRADRPAAFAAGLPAFYGPNTPESIRDWGDRMIMESSPFAIQALTEMMFTTDFRTDVAGIAVPTLILHGDMDASAPLPITGQPTAALIKGSVLNVYEGEPHGLVWSARERVNADVIAFLKA